MFLSSEYSRLVQANGGRWNGEVQEHGLWILHSAGKPEVIGEGYQSIRKQGIYSLVALPKLSVQIIYSQIQIRLWAMKVDVDQPEEVGCKNDSSKRRE